MRNLNDIQQALINIFKVSIQEGSLKELVKTCHQELINLMGEEKARNFYLALHVGDLHYILPYYHDEKDCEDPVDTPFSLEGGLTDYIRQKGKTELVDNLRHQELIKEGRVGRIVGQASYEWVGAPLIYGGEVHGVLVVQTYLPDIHYTDDDVELIDFVSRNISLAIERDSKDCQLKEYRQNLEYKVRTKSKEVLEKNTHLENEIAKVKKNEKIQKVLFEISEAKSNARDLRDLLKTIHAQVGTLMDASNFYVAIVEDREKGLYRLPYIVDENPGDIFDPDAVVDLSIGFTHYVMRTQQPLLADEKKVAELDKQGQVKQIATPSRSWLGIPLRTDGGETLGVVAVQSYQDPEAYSPIDQEVLSIISTTIAGAVDHKQLEEEKDSLVEKLLESQKLEAVGVLAAGVAHEFNNLLSIIIGHSYSGFNSALEDSPDYKRYSKIIKTSERASELVDKLMIFAQKRDRGKFLIRDMSKAIQNSALKMKDKLPPGCDFIVDVDEDLLDVKMDREELDDVLCNILDNALRALEGRENGHVKLTAKNFRGRPPQSLVRKRCRYIYISIEDNGHGMSVETREQIFNPFFTTRDPGQGTGLGLAIVYAIINEYYGSILVDSEKDKGTIFHIYLPTAFDD